MAKSVFQKKLNAEPEPDKNNYNEYETSFIQPPSEGPHQLEEYMAEALDVDFFTQERINKSITSFQKAVTKRLGEEKLFAIEEAIALYTKSAFSKKEPLLILKKTIVENEGLAEYLSKKHNCLYLEKFPKRVSEISLENALFTIDDLAIYRSEALKVVKRVFGQYINFLKKRYTDGTSPSDIDDIILFKGYNNNFYRDNNNKQGSDFLSLYAGLNNGTFYEPNILNSYSLSHVVAEKFMVSDNSIRRAFVITTFEDVKDRILSSFLNSPAFVPGQFEILITATNTPLTIQQDMNEPELYASFTVSK